MRKGSDEDRTKNRVIAVAIFGVRGGVADRAHRAAVERAAKHDDPLTPSHLLRQLDRRFHRLGARVGEPELLNRRRGDLGKTRCCLHHGVVAEDAAGVEEAIDLAMGGGDHGRVVVTQVDHCGSAGEVGVSAAVGRVNPDPLGALGDDVGIERDYGRDK